MNVVIIKKWHIQSGSEPINWADDHFSRGIARLGCMQQMFITGRVVPFFLSLISHPLMCYKCNFKAFVFRTQKKEIHSEMVKHFQYLNHNPSSEEILALGIIPERSSLGDQYLLKYKCPFHFLFITLRTYFGAKMSITVDYLFNAPLLINAQFPIKAKKNINARALNRQPTGDGIIRPRIY